MAAKLGPKIVNDGLVLCLDAADANSYAGEPTTNFFYRETPRIDSSYSSYVYNSDSTWAANHPDAIRVYNTDGTEISSYVNTGANSGNWNVISHAHWVYDDELKKPVVRMHSIAGYESQWRALSRGLNHTLSELGLTAGDKFTISWLQKAYVTGVYALAGLYMKNTGGSNGFHAGQATSSDVGQLSSELGKWAHKSKTFTVPSGMNETGFDVSLYMYGHYSPTNQNEILISDVQVEAGDYATPIVQGVSSTNSGYWGTRSATNGWVDRSGNSNNGTLTNMIGTEVTHYRDGQVIMPVANSYLDFDGSNDRVQISHSTQLNNAKSWEIWFKIDSFPDTSTYDSVFSKTANWNQQGGILLSLIYGNLRFSYGGYWSDLVIESISNMNTNTWYQVVGTGEDTGSGILMKGYLNGVYKGSLTRTAAFVPTNTNALYLGFGNGGTMNGQIAIFRVYEQTLTAAEVLSNYNATKGRFS